MKNTWVLSIGLAMLCGCARFSAQLADTNTSTNTNGVVTAHTVTTRLKGVTWFSSTQSITKFKTSNTDKTQSVGGDGVRQTGATNTVEALKYIDSIVSKLSVP